MSVEKLNQEPPAEDEFNGKPLFELLTEQEEQAGEEGQAPDPEPEPEEPVKQQKQERPAGQQQQQRQQQAPPAAPPADTYEKAAALYVETLDFVVSRACVMFAGESADMDAFKMKYGEKKAYKGVSQAFFKTMEFTVSPGLLFAIVTITVIAGPAMAVLEHRKKAAQKKEREERLAALNKKRAEMARTQGQAGAQGVLFEDAKDKEEASTIYEVDEAELERGDFTVDANGFYTKKPGGQYIKKEERSQKPSATIKMLLDEQRTNAEIKSFIVKNCVKAKP